jgi:hypothetical protein
VAERDPPFDRQAGIEQLYADLNAAKQLAFEKQSDNGLPMPDLANLARFLELQAKVYGLLSADGKRAPDAGGSFEVPIEKAKRLIRDAELKLKEKKNEDE